MSETIFARMQKTKVGLKPTLFCSVFLVSSADAHISISMSTTGQMHGQRSEPRQRALERQLAHSRETCFGNTGTSAPALELERVSRP